jgi:hypothetical protein
MREWRWALCFAGAALTIVPSNANAACAPADLAGLWDAYAVGAEDADPYWTRCSIRFSSTARILSGNSCLTNNGNGSTLSGRLTVNSNCRVTGRFTQHFNAGGSATCNIPQSTLSKDKEVVTGVGKCSGGEAIFSFNMVKR